MIFLLRLTLGLGALASMSLMIFLSITGTSSSRLDHAGEETRRLQVALEAIQSRKKHMFQSVPSGASLPENVLWGLKGPEGADIALQQVVLDAAKNAGLSLASFGRSTGPSGLAAPTIGFEIEGTGGHEDLARFLAMVESNDPRLAVSYLWIRQLAAEDGQVDAPISVRLSLWGFRESEPAQ